MENKFINITLPDGTVLNKPIGITGYDIAYAIKEDPELKSLIKIKKN